jgi:predicted transcriptional regulator
MSKRQAFVRAQEMANDLNKTCYVVYDLIDKDYAAQDVKNIREEWAKDMEILIGKVQPKKITKQ